LRIKTLHTVLHGRGPIFWIALAALILRLVYVLVLDTSPDFSGGDANWYMMNGRDLVTTGKTAGPLQTGPVYPMFVGAVQVVIPGHETTGVRQYTHLEMQVTRVIQSLLSAALCVFAYVLAARTLGKRIGLLAASILAISPALIIDAGNLTTEAVFMFLVFGGLAWYASAHPVTPRRMVIAGILFGLASLTRPVFLLFPLGIALHLWLTQRAHRARLILVLLTSYGLMVSTWTAYNVLVWDRFIVGGEGFLSFVHQGITGQVSSQQADETLGVSPETTQEQRDETLRQEIEESIRSDPAGWFTHRVKNLGKAYLQPHNTVHFKGKSIQQLASNWLRKDRSLSGLIDLTHTQSFWPKLLLYIFHYSGLLLGAAGMWIRRRQWRALLPLYGMIGYFTGIHLVLLALPRYLFPVYPVFWIFAASFILAAWEWRSRRESHKLAAGRSA
jgi:4-amino-4-deoxy-L-arabinose transferase-like glycosyltransferase